jgi:hypothetical protein
MKCDAEVPSTELLYDRDRYPFTVTPEERWRLACYVLAEKLFNGQFNRSYVEPEAQVMLALQIVDERARVERESLLDIEAGIEPRYPAAGKAQAGPFVVGVDPAAPGGGWTVVAMVRVPDADTPEARAARAIPGL